MKVLEWNWVTWVKRELYFTQKFPIWDITSVTNYCYNKNEIYLTKNKRWWEIPAGHLEEWEDSIDALRRETLEEIWWDILEYKFIWYYKVYWKSWINYSIIYMSQVEIISKPTWKEIKDSAIVSNKNILDYLWNPDLYNYLIKYNYLWNSQ